MAEIDLAGLRGTFRGAIITPTDPDYETARRVWNGMIDKHPAVIARCTSAADVQAAVNFGRDNGLLIAVRGGGHSFPGHSTCDGGLVIDLSPMKTVTVDAAARTARAEGGATWADLDGANERHGLAVTGGQISHTGIAGLSLGGGFGWLMRRQGMTVDAMIGADVVTADGRLLHASETENSDLFWGLRGGGGNFGVVTAFDYALQPLSGIVGGLIGYPLPEGVSVLKGYREAAKDAPEELTTAVSLLTTPDGHKAAGVAVCWAGAPEAADAAIAPFRTLGTAVLQQVAPMPYTVMQSLLNEAAVPGRRYYMRSSFLEDVADGYIEAVVQAFADVPSPMTTVLLVQMGGAVSRVAPDAMAYAHRNAGFSTTVFSCWEQPAADDANIAWTRDTWEKIKPYMPGTVYVNELGDEGDDRVREAYGANYPRLAALKTKYDPANLFRLNQNIKPG
jgi:FAD/FMN-containing dehydrogenase